MPNRAPLDLSQLSLRSLPGRGADRAYVVGGSGSGKSELADQLGFDWDRRYWNKKGKRLILDRKPRYKAQWNINGTKATRRYKNWDHGPLVYGSVLVEEPRDLEMAWKLGYHVAVCQGDSDSDIPRMLAVAEEYHKRARASQPQLLQVDECLLFFGPTGQPKGGNDILKTYVIAGRERGVASIFCSQRTKGLPPSIMEELNRLYLFRLDYKDDFKRLQEMGAPVEMEDVPTEEHEFMYWTKASYRDLWGPYKLDLG